MKTKLMALAALQYARRFMRPTECDIEYVDKQIAAIKAAIETPAEPVQWQVCRGGVWEWCKDDELAFYKSCNLDVRPLYTTPQELVAAGWVSVDDRLPEPWTEVLVYPRPSDYCCEAQMGRAGCETYWEYSEYEAGFGDVKHRCNVTHWMPLPAAPGCAA